MRREGSGAASMAQKSPKRQPACDDGFAGAKCGERRSDLALPKPFELANPCPDKNLVRQMSVISSFIIRGRG
jgi:hypothetical protein